MKRSNPSHPPQSKPLVRITVCVLAGGRSTRMGQDKAGLRLGRQTMLGRVRAIAGMLEFPVHVLRRDRVPRCGPLGGIYTALQTGQADIVLFLSCDMPFVKAAWLRKLLERLGTRTRAVFTVVDGLSGFPFALRAGCLPIVQQQLASQQYSLQALARELQAKRLAPAPSEKGRLANVNTPADLLRARRRVANPMGPRAGPLPRQGAPGPPGREPQRRPRHSAGRLDSRRRDQTAQSSKDRTRRRPRR